MSHRSRHHGIGKNSGATRFGRGPGRTPGFPGQAHTRLDRSETQLNSILVANPVRSHAASSGRAGSAGFGSVAVFSESPIAMRCTCAWPTTQSRLGGNHVGRNLSPHRSHHRSCESEWGRCRPPDMGSCQSGGAFAAAVARRTATSLSPRRSHRAHGLEDRGARTRERAACGCPGRWRLTRTTRHSLPQRSPLGFRPW